MAGWKCQSAVWLSCYHGWEHGRNDGGGSLWWRCFYDGSTFSGTFEETWRYMAMIQAWEQIHLRWTFPKQIIITSMFVWGVRSLSFLNLFHMNHLKALRWSPRRIIHQSLTTSLVCPAALNQRPLQLMFGCDLNVNKPVLEKRITQRWVKNNIPYLPSMKNSLTT